MTDEKKSQFKAITKRVSSMTEAERAALSERMGQVISCEGHPLSFRNSAMIYLQGCKSPTVVGGFRQWLKHGRSVMKGEHGFSILFPSSKKSADGKDGDTFFCYGTVFDIGQTQEIVTS